ncbi:unnamed protein product, partial [Rotaria sordida]
WFTFKATRFYYVYNPILKEYDDECEREINEIQNISDHTSHDGDSTTDIGEQPLDDEFGSSLTQEAPPMIADM